MPPHTSDPVIQTSNDRAIGLSNDRLLHMFRSLFMSISLLCAASERAAQDLIRGLEGYALRPRDRGRQRTQEWRAPVVDLPPEQHGVVLVRGVVAVLHEHPTPVAELQRDVNGAVGVQPPDVLAALLPSRDVRRATVASQRLALLEVVVDGVGQSTAVRTQ